MVWGTPFLSEILKKNWSKWNQCSSKFPIPREHIKKAENLYIALSQCVNNIITSRQRKIHYFCYFRKSCFFLRTRTTGLDHSLFDCLMMSFSNCSSTWHDISPRFSRDAWYSYRISVSRVNYTWISIRLTNLRQILCKDVAILTKQIKIFLLFTNWQITLRSTSINVYCFLSIWSFALFIGKWHTRNLFLFISNFWGKVFSFTEFAYRQVFW